MKILINYLQLLMLMLSFNLNWPTEAMWFFATSGYASDSKNFISVDCLMGENAVYLKIVAMAMIPFFVIALAAMFWGCLAMFKRRSYRDKFFITCVVLFFLLHPSFTKLLLSAFACKELEGTDASWLIADYSVKCWEGPHLVLILGVAIPSLLMWGFGLPPLIFMIMKNSRNRNKQFGFLIAGYRK
jgi:hypothetical protein